MRLYSFVAAAALLSASLAAHADVMYSYTDNASNFGYKGSYFTVDSPDFLSYSTDPVTPTSGEAQGSIPAFSGPFTGIVFLRGAITGYFQTPSGVVLGNFYGGSYNIAMDGTYTDAAGETLTISGSPDAPPSSVTPEPSSLALLGTGLLGVVGVMRKRFA